MVRGSLARLEIVPNVDALLMSRFGRPKFTVLNTLKMSHRSVAARRGLSRIWRCTVRSTFWKPGTRERVARLVAEDAGRHRLERRSVEPLVHGLRDH